MMNLLKLREQIKAYRKDGMVHFIEHDGEGLWLKTAGEEKRNLLRVMSFKLSHFTPFQFFKVNSILAPRERLKLEIENIQAMKKANMAVPDIVLVGEDYFVTRNSGTMLTQLKLGQENVKKLYMLVFSTLAGFHQNDCYHGRPALRDIIVSDKGVITFIDFEESGFNNSQLMARDVFILLMDTSRIEALSDGDKFACLNEWADNVPSELVGELESIYKKAKRLTVVANLVLKFKDNKTSLHFLSSISVLGDFFEKYES